MIYVFFRTPTICLIVGAITGIITIKHYRVYRLEKRKQVLLMEFRDLLEALTTSFSSGRNTIDAFSEASQDLLDLHGEHSDIVREMRIILSGIANNLIIEDLLMDFADRSELDDISSFAAIFESCNRQGGNIKQIVWDTRKLFNEKIEMEIKTLLTEKENELNIMMVMLLVIMLSLNGLGAGTAVANTLMNVIVKLVAIGLFAAAYVIGRKIVKIKV